MSDQFICPAPNCGKKYTHASSMRRHRRNAHKHAKIIPTAKPGNGRKKCGLCDGTHASTELLCRHLVAAHGKHNMVLSSKEFENETIYRQWVQDESEKGKFSLCKSGTKIRVSEQLICNRSGSYTTKDEPKRMRKLVDGKKTIKIGFDCSAFVSAKFHPDGHVTVKYCLEHYGHEKNPACLPIPPRIESLVTDMLMDDRDPDYIIQKLHETRSANGDLLGRERLLSKNDIRNIKIRQARLPCSSNDCCSTSQASSKKRKRNQSKRKNLLGLLALESESTSGWTCPFGNCDVKCGTLTILNEHLEEIHLKKDVDESIWPKSESKSMECSFENCDFKGLSGALARHEKNEHQIVHRRLKHSELVCPVDDCLFVCTSLYNLSDHRKKVHGMKFKAGRRPTGPDGGRLQCPFENCNYRCNCATTMSLHRRNVHKILKRPVLYRRSASIEFTCPVKDCQFISMSNTMLVQHRKEIHGVTFETESGVNCFNCGWLISDTERCYDGFDSRNGLMEHLVTVHGEKLNIQNINFDRLEDFESWKKRLEYETRSIYVRNRGARKEKKHAVTIFECHRTGTCISRSNGQKKNKRSNKMDYCCSAFMRMSKSLETGKIQVTFCAEHYGHDFDLCRLPLKRRLELGASLKEEKSLMIRKKRDRPSKVTVEVQETNEEDIAQFGMNIAQRMSVLSPRLQCYVKARLSEVLQEAEYEQPPVLEPEPGSITPTPSVNDVIENTDEPYYVYVDYLEVD